MVDPITTRRWLYHLLFAGLALLTVFIQVLPVTIEVGSWPGPDVIFALAIAWGLRRPDYMPPLLIGGVVLIADLVLQRPPGLWAAIVVLAIEVVRARNALWRDLPFMLEWAIVSALIAACILLYWLILAVTMVGQAAIGLYLIQIIATVIAYPVVVVVSAFVLGVRKVAPGQVDALGHPL